MTPFDRFKEATKKILAVPKKDLPLKAARKLLGQKKYTPECFPKPQKPKVSK